MKYLILFIALVSCCLSNDKLNNLENSYVTKAEKLKTIRDKVVSKADEDRNKIVTEADIKLATDSKRLAEAYLKSLKKVEVAIVQKGDLDAALKVRAKIKEIEKIIKGEAIANPKSIPKPVITKTSPVGRWIHYKSNVIYTFAESGILTQSKGYKGVWKMISPSSFTINWSHQKTTEIHFIVSNGQQLKTKNILWANKFIDTDQIIGPKLDGRVYRWSSTQKIIFQTDGTVIKGSGSFTKSSSQWKEISPGVIQWSIYKFHFADDLSYYYIEKGGKKYDKKIQYLGMLKPALRTANRSKHFYTSKEQFINTTWIAYDGDGKKTGVELILLAGGKFKSINAPWFKSYWKWGFKDGCIIYGASTVTGCKVTFAKNGGSTTSFYNIGRKESYKGFWVLKK